MENFFFKNTKPLFFIYECLELLWSNSNSAAFLANSFPDEHSVSPSKAIALPFNISLYHLDYYYCLLKNILQRKYLQLDA